MTGYAWNPFLRFPRASLAITALFCLPLALRLATFQVSSETRALLQGDRRNLASYDQVRQILGETEVVAVSVELDDLFSARGLEIVRRVSQAFVAVPGVVDVKSLTHAYKPVRRGMTFEMVPLVPGGPSSAAELARLREFCLSHPLVRNVMVAEDGRHTLLLVTFGRRFEAAEEQQWLRERTEAVLAPFRAEGLRFRVLALPLIEGEIRATLRRDLQRFVPAAAGLLLAILWLTFRSWGVLAMVLASQAFALSLLPGLIELGGFRLNVFSVMLFPLLTGLHLTLLAHLFTAFQAAWADTKDGDAALERALQVTLKPSAFATLTTMAGLLSLTIGGVAQTREFGWLGACGLGWIHLVTFGPTLALLKLVSRRWPNDPAPCGNDPVNAASRVVATELRPCTPAAPAVNPVAAAATHDGRRAAWFREPAAGLTAFAQHRRRWVFGAMAVAVALTVAGVRLIRTDIRPTEFLEPSSPTRQAIEELNRVYGGINVVQIEFDSGSTNGINQMAFLRYLESVHRFAESRANLSGVHSYPQLLAMMNQIWEAERPGSLRLPENPLWLNLFVLALRSYDFPFLTALADPPNRTAYLVLRTRDLSADRYLTLIHEVVAYAESTRPPGVTVTATKGIHSILEADRQILRSQRNSAGLTLAVIGVMLALLWRSVPLALASLLTNAIPVALVVAVAGFTRIPLNSITVMVAALSLGIAVDNSIHFITYWLERRRAGLTAAEAVAATLRVKGRPIVWTDAILVAIFSVFWFSSFPPVAHFGVLSAIAFLGALVAVLVLLPAMLLARQ